MSMCSCCKKGGNNAVKDHPDDASENINALVEPQTPGASDHGDSKTLLVHADSEKKIPKITSPRDEKKPIVKNEKEKPKAQKKKK